MTIDLRPGAAIDFSTSQLADLGAYGTPGPGKIFAQGNIYNALLYNSDKSTEISGLKVGSGNDTIYQDDLKDTITLGSGTDTVYAADGGAVISRAGTLAGTLVFAGSLAQYSVMLAGSTATIIDSNTARTGTETETGLRYLQFSDYTLDMQSFHTITFSEYPLYTVNPTYTYADNTITVLGEIVGDSAQPATPAVAANTSYTGPVSVGFLNPVTHLEFDAGYFDAIGSSTIVIYGPGGTVLSSQTNSGYGIIHYSFNYATGISGFAVNNTSYDPSGFSVDTITTDGTLAATPKIETVNISPLSAMKTDAATGSTGTYTFNVTRSGVISAASSIAYAVVGAGSNPLAPSDVVGGVLPVGTVSFAAGQATAVATVNIKGAQITTNKTFSVNLFAPAQDTVIGTAVATGTVLAKAPLTDLNADGKSDVLLQNINGTVAGWNMNGPSIASSAIVVNPSTSWHAAGSGDFNGDGKSDVLLQNDDGSVAIWEMNGETIATSAIVANPGPSWHAMTTGDFNGDGLSDIAFQGNDGSVAIWQMNATSIASSAIVLNPGPSWHLVAAGDLNGDAKSDLILQNDDGTVAVWLMNGTSVASTAFVANPGASWHVTGSGDFNGDGKSDILLQNNNGSVAVWQMNGSSIVTSAVVANPGPNWHTTATADYNGDGKSDILLQADDGTVADWQMNGTVLATSALVADPGPTWETIGLGSLNFIDSTATNGTLNATILNDDFVFTTFQPGAHAISGFDPLHDVITLNQTTFPNFAAVQQNETQVNGSVVINLGNNNSLTLNGILTTALSAKNFV